MTTFKNVNLVKKANIYFDGKVTSRSFTNSFGDELSLGIMQIGEYHFTTSKPEIMEIVEGSVSVKLEGEDTYTSYTTGMSFNVKKNSYFDIKVLTISDYCCSYLN